MRRALVSLLAAGLLAGVVVAPVAAAKGPRGPEVTANCTVGGATTYSWSHLNVIAFQVWWMTPDYVTYVATTPVFANPHPKKSGKGSVATASNVPAGDLAFVDFIYDANGDAWQAQATCN